MEAHDIAFDITHYYCLGIFIWLVFLDQITPIPEELVLLTIGDIGDSEFVNPFLQVCIICGCSGHNYKPVYK